ncbi:MAG: SdrD B-like domain-containing protein, partial [Bacteroidota bacterium]
MKHISILFFLCICFSLTTNLFAQVDTALIGGNWNDPLIWSNGIPDENTDVVIIGGPTLTNTVTIPAGDVGRCRNIQVNGATGTRVLTEANAKLEIYGTVGSDTVGHSLLIIDNTKGTNSFTVFKRQTSGPLYGAKWDGARPAYIRVIIDVPQNVTVWADTTFKSLRLTVTSGIFDLKNHDIRLDSTNSNSLKGHLYIGAGTTVKNVRAIYKFGTLSTQCSTVTVAGTLEIDSTIAVSAFKLIGKGTIKTKAVSAFTANPAVFDASSATASGSVFEYARSGNQNIFGGASGVTYSGLMLSGSGQKIIGGTTPVTVNDSLIYSGTAIHSGTINRSANMWLVYAGTSPMTTSSELLSTSKKLKIRNTGGVTIDKSLGAISDLWGQVGTLSTASFSVSITSGGTLIRTKGTFSGNFTIPSDITLIYNNTDSIVTTNEMPSSVQNLKLQSTSVVRLANNLTVTGICSLQSGRLQPGTKTLTFSNASAVAATNGWIDGSMTVNINSVGTKLFPVGTISDAHPVAVNFSSITNSGSVTAQVITSPHPNTQYGDSTLKHYWTFTKGGGFTTFNATMNFTYPENDIFNGGDENTYVAGKYDTPYWQFPNISARNPATNSLTLSDVTTFSDFVIGKNIPTFIGYPSAKIKGMKFNDLNANGIFELGENGLSGWTIIANGLISNDTTTTDGLGEYTLDNLYGGTYTVKEQLVAPWIQSYPTIGTHTVSVVQDSIVTNINFGNHKNGKISGLKFNDLNGDGAKDISEPGIANWKIKLDGSTHNNVPVNDSAFTDNDGNYSFPDVPIGNYSVTEEYYPGWLQTYPGGTGIYVLAIQSDANLNNITFGNFLLGTISGHTFEDINGNGNLDAGEPGVGNWKIRLNGTTTINTVISESTMTDGNGNFQFTNLRGGTYTISEEIASGWTQTFPPNTSYTDAITSGSNLTNRNFGNFKDGVISGIVYNDINGNGIKDASDIGIQNWQMKISGTASDTVATDENGNYTFTGLQVGNYSVAKINQEGWTQTFPLETGYDVQILSSSVAANKNFGVFKLGVISGIVFEDVNGDGIKDNSEPGIINRTISLNTDFNQTLSNANGEYAFTDLPADQYIVTAEPIAGWL